MQFQSHLDGSKHMLTPEDVMDIERGLGSDMIMPLDECAPYPCNYEQAEESVRRTTLLGEAHKRVFFLASPMIKNNYYSALSKGLFMKIYANVRLKNCWPWIFPAYAIGGVSVGEPVDLMFKTIDWVKPLLPKEKPRYLMGIGPAGPDRAGRGRGDRYV